MVADWKPYTQVPIPDVSVGYGSVDVLGVEIFNKQDIEEGRPEAQCVICYYDFRQGKWLCSDSAEELDILAWDYLPGTDAALI